MMCNCRLMYEDLSSQSVLHHDRQLDTVERILCVQQNNCASQLLLYEWTKHDEGHFDLKDPRIGASGL